MVLNKTTHYYPIVDLKFGIENNISDLRKKFNEDDFVVLPNPDYYDENTKEEDFKNLLRTEHQRINLISEDALNHYEYFNTNKNFNDIEDEE